MTAEEWRPIPGWEGAYEVSDHGRVRSIDRDLTSVAGWTRHHVGRVLRFKYDRRGYRFVQLYRPARPRSVHQLVLEAFVGPRPEGLPEEGPPEGRHLDGDQLNNIPSNLCWGTHSENMHDRVRHGRHPMMGRSHCPGRHRLVDPNLIFSHGGRQRRCRACHNAHSEARNARLRGEVIDVADYADRRYQKIMSEAAA